MSSSKTVISVWTKTLTRIPYDTQIADSQFFFEKCKVEGCAHTAGYGNEIREFCMGHQKRYGRYKREVCRFPRCRRTQVATKHFCSIHCPSDGLIIREAQECEDEETAPIKQEVQEYEDGEIVPIKQETVAPISNPEIHPQSCSLKSTSTEIERIAELLGRFSLVPTIVPESRILLTIANCSIIINIDIADEGRNFFGGSPPSKRTSDWEKHNITDVRDIAYTQMLIDFRATQEPVLFVRCCDQDMCEFLVCSFIQGLEIYLGAHTIPKEIRIAYLFKNFATDVAIVRDDVVLYKHNILSIDQWF